MNLEEFVRENKRADVSALALRMRQYPELDAAFALQQIEGWQRAEHKLPELAAIEGWLWPKRLSVEQCSSQRTAVYKRQVLEKWTMENGQLKIGEKLIDLTGGLGVDTYYLSEGFDEVHYVERDEELCRLAEHNFALAGKNVQVHSCSAEEYLRELGGEFDTAIFIDPARRDSHGGKVFRLEDCEPNVVELLSLLRACARRILLKLSPMLDITEAVRELGGAAEVHVVAVRNEVKEVLVLLEEGCNSLDPEIICVNLETEEEGFVFRKSEEEHTPSPLRGTPPILGGELNKANGTNRANGANEEFMLIEPNAAIMKAGAFKTFGERYGLGKLDANSHLYVVSNGAETEEGSGLDGVQSSTQESSEPVSRICTTFRETTGSKNSEDPECLEGLKFPFSNFPGRVFRVHVATKDELKNLKKANVICRNYPLSADALKKKLRVQDGGEIYLISTRIAGKTAIFIGHRQFLHN